jgi:hypothetical protein
MKVTITYKAGGLKAPPGGQVRVGIMGESASKDHDGIALGKLAQVLHDGNGTIPARPFLSIAMRRPEVVAAIKRQGQRVLRAEADPATALALIGEVGRNAVLQTIVDRVPPPNAPSTIAAKGSDVPLVNEGVLKGSIAYQVEGAEELNRGALAKAKELRRAESQQRRAAHREQRLVRKLEKRVARAEKQVTRKAKKTIKRATKAVKQVKRAGKKVARKAKKALR